jgi:tetratricopeptide (TPR) repeat protein
VVLAALAVHARTLGFRFTGLDDRDLIVDDFAFLAGPGAVWRVFGRTYMHVVDAGHAYYRPVVAASFALDARWSGLDPRGFHLTNVAIYCAAAALAHGLFRTLAFGRGVTLAAGLVFAVHPALSPAVAWIPGRNDALAAVACLAAWLAFVRDRERPAWSWRLAHFALFALALLTKEASVLLPVACVAHVAATSPGAWDRLKRPGVLGAFALGWATLVAARLALHPPDARPGAREASASLLLFVSSLGKVVLPVNPTVLAVPEDLAVWPGLVAAGAIGAATFLVPGVRRRVIALGAAVFVAFLAPVAIFAGPLILDSRLVLPACGALLAVAEIVRALGLDARTLAGAAGAAVAGLASLTLAFEGAFHDERAFAREAVAGSPHASLAHVCRGKSYQSAGDDERALAEYRAALALGPAEVVHNNIAVIQMARGRWQDAERELGEELALNPRYRTAYLNLAIVLRHEGRMAAACAAARQAAAGEGLAGDPQHEEDRDCGPGER